jgi:hypothetical protein
MAKRRKTPGEKKKKRRRSNALSTFETGSGASKRNGESNGLLNFNESAGFNGRGAKTKEEKRRKKRVFRGRNGF